MKAVLLAAGRGSRLGGLTAVLPKALVPVRGDPLIHYMLRLCETVGFEETIVVGGFEPYKLEAYLSRREKPCRFVINREFRLGNLLTLCAARPYLEGDFLIANIDHIYPPALFQKFLKAAGPVVCAADFDRRLGSDDMKIRIDGKGRIKAIGKRLPVFDGGYIGMTQVRREVGILYVRAIDATLSRKGTGAVVEDVLDTLIQWGELPTLSDLSGFGWWEIDTPEELRKAERGLA